MVLGDVKAKNYMPSSPLTPPAIHTYAHDSNDDDDERDSDGIMFANHASRCTAMVLRSSPAAKRFVSHRCHYYRYRPPDK